MNPGEEKVTSATGEFKIVAEIQEMFRHYGPTFVELAVGKRSDMNALLDFYGAPLRFIGPTFHMVMKDNAAITGPDGVGGEIQRLRRAGFAGSSLDKCQIKVLNSRASIVEAVWLRRDNAGAVMERFGVIYLVVLTTEGWRITSAVSLP
jgi:hypothetical protein